MICQPREEDGGQPHALQAVGDINPLARSIACIDNVSRAADHGRAARGHQGHVADVIDAAIALGHRFGQFAEPRHQPIIARFARKIARESLAPSRGQAVSFRPIAQTNVGLYFPTCPLLACGSRRRLRERTICTARCRRNRLLVDTAGSGPPRQRHSGRPTAIRSRYLKDGAMSHYRYHIVTPTPRRQSKPALRSL